MAQQKQPTTIIQNNDFSEIAGRVAVGASSIALVSGIIAIGAAAMSDQKTRDKIVKDSRSVFDNFRQVVMFLRKEAETTGKELKELSGKNN